MKRLGIVLLGVLVAGTLAWTAVSFADDGENGIEHEGDHVTLAAGPGQTVQGETDLDAGETVTLRITSTGSSQPFLRSTEATIADDGSFEATVDMQGIENGSTANLSVRHDGAELYTATVEVVPCEDDCAATTETGGGQTQEAAGTTVSHDGETVTLVAGQEQQISGHSSLTAGTELQVVLRSTGASSPFLVRENATVQEDGSFTATVDLESVPAGANASLTVRHGEEELAQTAVTIEPCEDCPAQASADDPEGRSEFELTREVVPVRQNATGEIPVTLGDADAATLQIGSDDVNYQITATATDGDDDGLVVFVLDPSAAGSETPTVTARNANDSVAIGNETGVDGPLSAADYDLSLFRGTSASGNVSDVGTVTLLAA